MGLTFTHNAIRRAISPAQSIPDHDVKNLSRRENSQRKKLEYSWRGSGPANTRSLLTPMPETLGVLVRVSRNPGPASWLSGQLENALPGPGAPCITSQPRNLGLPGNAVGFPGFQNESCDTYIPVTQDSVTKNLAVPIPRELLLGCTAGPAPLCSLEE